MSELQVGVIGLGLGHHHAAAYDQAEAVSRIVICDPDPARLERTRSAFGKVAAAYRDLQEMLRAERLDAVSIVTPDHLHRTHAEMCLRAGCHVLLTKPLATNLADGRAVVRAAEAAGRKFMVAHERRFRSHVRRIKELLDAGALGEVITVQIDAIQDKRSQFARSPWYASAEAGRTPLVGSGIHEVDLMRYFVGRPIESVFAFSNRLGTLEFPTHKTTVAIYRFEGGAIGQVTVTYEAHWPPAGGAPSPFRLVGTRGIIVGNRVAIDGREDWEDLPADPQPIVTGTFGCVENFLQAILNDAPVAVGGREALASLAACVAADESAATGAPTVPAPSDLA